MNYSIQWISMDMQKADEKIVSWLKDKMQQAGAKGIVVGMSGGIDSACVAVLSKKAAGENMLGVIMPCHSNPQDMEDAKAVAKKFGIKTVEVNLENTLGSITGALGDDPKNKKLEVANMKPRLRMTTLYYFANKHNYLVAGTDNKTEALQCYFTKYGDGGVDINPIGNLYKTQVRQFARHLGIPEQVITKPPSAGLWDGQTDEGELGITYDLLDKILERLFDKKISVDSVAKELDITLAEVQKVLDRYEKGKHKLSTPPSPELD